MKATSRRARTIGAALAVLAIGLTSCSGVGAAKPAFRPSLRWGSCPADVEIQYFTHHRCGWLTDLQDRSQPTGKTVRLLVVKTWPVGETPLPGLNSGFGSDLGNALGYTDRAAGATRTDHVSISIEVRGTGHSQPSLACPEVDALGTRESHTLTASRSLRSDFLAAVAACHERLTGQGVVPADYDIQNVARDLDDLRTALGIDRWAFLASYGTQSRYLFEYLREFPSRVGAAWFDSPQFPQADELSAGIDGTRYALNQLFTACAADARCHRAYPDLRSLWRQALTRLELRPLRGSVVVDAGKLLRAARLALSGDGPENLTTLPAMIAAAARGRLDPGLRDLVAGDPLYCSGYRPSCTGSGVKDFSLGVYLTTLCRDEAPFIDRAALAAEAGGDRVLDAVFLQDPYLAACKEWKVPPASSVIHEPVHTDLPQLLVTGQFDSFSPPPVARAAAKGSGRAWVLVVPGQTHNALGFSDCPIGIRNAWVRNATSPPADTACLNDMGIEFRTKGV